MLRPVGLLRKEKPMSKLLSCRALAKRVLAVAVEGAIGDWTAYIDAVAGSCHSSEAEEVTRTGVKLDVGVAALLFPHLDIKKWRT
jgi:hypothetical protein